MAGKGVSRARWQARGRSRWLEGQVRWARPGPLRVGVEGGESPRGGVGHSVEPGWGWTISGKGGEALGASEEEGPMRLRSPEAEERDTQPVCQGPSSGRCRLAFPWRLPILSLPQGGVDSHNPPKVTQLDSGSAKI